ncbi:esterase family protein [Nostoc ellipsosporum NOK]|nr:esterase family protein [Nostoc ellipsosporum NOK]
MKKLSLLTLIALFATFCYAAGVDTVVIYSNSMQKKINCVVITPDAARQPGASKWPTVYLLHGYSGNYSNWIKKVPALKAYADDWQMIIVCPDGDYSSWYFDSPVDKSMRYETYVSKEVPAYIEEHYPALSNRNGRAISGLSMGGHGALFLAFRHPGVFGACGSMSGGVNLYPFRDKFDIAKRLGDTIRYRKNWDDYSVLHVIEKKRPADSLAIIFDCGTEDFFYADNKALHQKMLKLKIQHDYIERAGAHNWDYWGNAVGYQLLFFHQFFDKYNKR